MIVFHRYRNAQAKFWRCDRALALTKFTTVLPTHSQSLAPQDASSWTFGSARPTQKS
ncbi:hypothetical protein DPMN_006457 [Dreissena polymorpha]|uniref:Uncharacterized protein n=1 Tax=Dreissena polymorpha TaxID=45954 RepID=A0A9D4MRH4_DREPO|nr:hypothetical protein DPMN_006457 [Dreissena polymorpha]